MKAPPELLSHLESAARQAAQRSYSPYSRFPVGAATLAISGEIFDGTNVENASFGLSVCAERVALWKAVSAGHRQIAALAVYTPTEEPTPPCGACLQVLAEFGKGARVISFCDGKGRLESTMEALLPATFSFRKTGHEGS